MFDASQAREEQRLYEAGQYEDAAKLVKRIHLLRYWIRPRLVQQVEQLGDDATTRALPFLEAVAWSSQNPLLMRRFAEASVSPDPTRLVVKSVVVAPAKPPAAASPPPDLFRATPKGDQEPDANGGAVLLERKNGEAWESLGAGFAGTLGNSFDLSQDGRVLWMAQADQRLVRVELADGKQRAVPVNGPPGLVALAPGDPDKLAYSLESPQGDVVYIWDHGKSRQLFPPEGAKPAPGLVFEWADDGKSLAVRWEEQDPSGQSNTQLVWLRPDGKVGLEATLETPLAESDPTWARAQGDERMGLAAGGGTWVWDEREDKAVELAGLGDVWGFGPAGKLVASLDGPRLVIVDVSKPTQRIQLDVPDLPPAFEAEPGSFRWARDENGNRISVRGGVPDLQGKPTAITVKLSIKR